ncbi:MAG: recombinase family protein [Bacteroidales bacterium]|nr:recombinase family protein [Bacteroidales bacterium]
MNKTAVIYARVSSTTDRQNTERQIADLSSYADKAGLVIAGKYEEHISGAKKNEERAVLAECLEFCFSNKVSVLLLSEMSRLSRNVWELQETIKKCVDAQLNVYFQKEGISLLGSDGKPSLITPIMVSVLGVCAEMERENIKFRLNSGRAKFIADGGKLGRKVGYRKSDEQKKEQYAEVLRDLRKGKSMRDIAKLYDVSLSTVQRLKKEFVK